MRHALTVTGWCPQHPTGPMSDDTYFELLTAAVFEARFRPAIVQQRWPAIRRAFAQFDLQTVATWSDDRLDHLLQSPGIIRNPKKILATLRNARELARIAATHGTVAAYMARYRQTPERLVAEIDRWAHYIGAPSIRFFLRCCGHEENARAA